MEDLASRVVARLCSLETIIYFLAFNLLQLVFLRIYLARTTSKPPAGCRKIGLATTSNLDDERTDTASGSQAAKSASRPSVKALFIYPIKACAPLEISHGTMLRTGLEHDRQFVFAQRLDSKDEPGWKFITQRSHPLLALVQPTVWVPDHSVPAYSPDGEWVRHGGCLELAFPTPQKCINHVTAALSKLGLAPRSMTTCRIPLCPDPSKLSVAPVTVWADSPPALDLSSIIKPDTLGQLASLLNISTPFTLFSTHPSHPRSVVKNPPASDEIDYAPIYRFADAYPLLIMNIASIRDVNKRLPATFGNLDPRRFRANIYVEGPEPYAEDAWTAVKIRAGDEMTEPTRKNVYAIRIPTTRCTVPNVNPETGTTIRYSSAETGEGGRYNEPLKTLKTYRCIDEANPGKPCLGVQMLAAADPEAEDANGKWQVKVGDEVKVLDWQEFVRGNV